MIILKAPAKINWFLNVLNKRDDGYHGIISLMQRVTLNDTITLEHSDTVEIATDSPITKEENLVYKAAMTLRERAGAKSGVRITLEKEIPMEAGLGGGSSDAASTLTGLHKLWSLDISRNELVRIGASIGSDVPFFLDGPLSMVEGRGEITSPLKVDRSYPILLVKPPLNVSTAWAYAELDRVAPSRAVLTKGEDVIKLFSRAFEKGDFSLLSSIRVNDFDAAVAGKHPEIGEIKRNLIDCGALFSAMSGSGPTVFGVFGSVERAREALGHMLPNWCRMVKTVASDG